MLTIICKTMLIISITALYLGLFAHLGAFGQEHKTLSSPLCLIGSCLGFSVAAISLFQSYLRDKTFKKEINDALNTLVDEKQKRL